MGPKEILKNNQPSNSRKRARTESTGGTPKEKEVPVKRKSSKFHNRRSSSRIKQVEKKKDVHGKEDNVKTTEKKTKEVPKVVSSKAGRDIDNKKEAIGFKKVVGKKKVVSPPQK